MTTGLSDNLGGIWQLGYNLLQDVVRSSLRGLNGTGVTDLILMRVCLQTCVDKWKASLNWLTNVFTFSIFTVASRMITPVALTTDMFHQQHFQCRLWDVYTFVVQYFYVFIALLAFPLWLFSVKCWNYFQPMFICSWSCWRQCFLVFS